MKKKVLEAALTAMAFSLEAERKKVREFEYIIDRINEDIRADREKFDAAAANMQNKVADLMKEYETEQQKKLDTILEHRHDLATANNRIVELEAENERLKQTLPAPTVSGQIKQ